MGSHALLPTLMNMTTSLMWFRRDLRLRDNPALAAAADRGDVTGVFVVDPVLWKSAGAPRRAWLAANLRALDEAMGGRLVVRHGDPAEVIPTLVRQIDADMVFNTEETSPYGVRRDQRVEDALGDVPMSRVGTPYLVAPGTVRNKSGEPYRVFTPFSRAWRDLARDRPDRAPQVNWKRADNHQKAEDLLARALGDGADLPSAGEDAAVRRWTSFVENDLIDYAEARDLPAQDRTSRMSPYLRLGVVHPRQLMEQLRDRRGKGRTSYETEIAWREFYGDVLYQHPSSSWKDLRPLGIEYDSPADREQDVAAWKEGATGFPIVDAGMRQLVAEGWMHNRVRMITASFFTKDLHLWWPLGARYFLEQLIDGDIASNNHGWQWVAGTGTDAAPYFRVFNPVTQGVRFDPDGDYVRRWVPELQHLPGARAHEPWKHDDGYDHGYPERIVDHSEERKEALARLDRARH